MVCYLHILVAVNLQDVASLLINGEASHHVPPVKLPCSNDLHHTSTQTHTHHMPLLWLLDAVRYSLIQYVQCPGGQLGPNRQTNQFSGF